MLGDTPVTVYWTITYNSYSFNFHSVIVLNRATRRSILFENTSCGCSGGIRRLPVPNKFYRTLDQ